MGRSRPGYTPGEWFGNTSVALNSPPVPAAMPIRRRRGDRNRRAEFRQFQSYCGKPDHLREVCVEYQETRVWATRDRELVSSRFRCRVTSELHSLVAGSARCHGRSQVRSGVPLILDSTCQYGQKAISLKVQTPTGVIFEAVLVPGFERRCDDQAESRRLLFAPVGQSLILRLVRSQQVEGSANGRPT